MDANWKTNVNDTKRWRGKASTIRGSWLRAKKEERLKTS